MAFNLSSLKVKCYSRITVFTESFYQPIHKSRKASSVPISFLFTSVNCDLSLERIHSETKYQKVSLLRIIFITELLNMLSTISCTWIVTELQCVSRKYFSSKLKNRQIESYPFMFRCDVCNTPGYCYLRNRPGLLSPLQLCC